jgi:hypothetical protein
VIVKARPLLLILNARRISECLDSYRALSIPKAYLTGYTERELEPVIAELVASTNFSHYIAVSDDVVVSSRAVHAVQELLGGHPVVTGWCNLDQQDPRCSVVDRPLTGDTPTLESYGFMHWSRVVTHPHRTLRTWFAGMCLTGMSRDLWQQYPFRTFGPAGSAGWASDFNLCRRLQDDRVPIMAARDAGVLHVRERWDVQDPDPRKRLHLGERTVTFV